MSEAKKVAIGVVSGVLGIAVVFALILMIVGKGDEPDPRPEPILAQQSKPVPPKPAPVQVQPQALLAEQPLTEPRAVSSAGRTTQGRGKASTSTSDAQAPAESTPPIVQAESLLGSATPEEKVPASSTRSEPNATPQERPSPPPVANRAPSGDTPSGTTATGIPTYVGPRWGVYHYSASGKKVYQRRGK